MRGARPAPAAGRGAAQLALVRRQVRRGAVVVAVTGAGLPALVAATHARVFADPAGVAGLQAVAANPAVRTLFGEPLALADPGGFAVWRTGTVVAVLLGVWTVLAVTRTTRGQEEAGHWDLLLAGPVGLRGATGRALAVVAAVPVVTGAGLAAALRLVGTRPAGALVHGAGTALLGLCCLAVAACCAQVFATRSGASSAAVAVLGAGLLLRMVGDGVADLARLRWCSPFGLLALSRPYAGDRALPLVVLAAAAAAVAAAALVVAGHRDVGAGLLAPRTRRRARTALLGTVETFAVRRALRPLALWSAGIGAYYLLLGLTAVSVTGFLAGNRALADRAAQAGFTGLDRLEGFTAAVCTLLAVPVGVFAATRLAAFLAAERDGRLLPLATQPRHRVRLLGAEVATTAAAVVVLTVVAGAATWAGTRLTGGALPLPAALAATLNTLPVPLLCLGAATAVAGLGLPAVTGVGSLPAAGGFLLLVLADSVGAPDGVRRLSPFAHLAAVPVEPARWPAALVLVGAGALLAGAGALAHRRRDLGR